MIENKPRILVVIPTLGKRNDFLRQALQSVTDQTPTLFDIALVFPLTNKDTMLLAKEFNAITIDDPGGMSAAVNAGIAKAEAWHEYIVWIGDDDLLKPKSLETSMKALDANQNAVVAFGYCDYIDEHGEVIFTSRAGSIAPWLMTWGPDLVPMMGLMMRRSSLAIAGEFDTSNQWCMDLDMLLRLRKIGKFINTKTTLSAFRWHVTSQTVSNRPKVLDETEKVKRKYLPLYLQNIAFLWERPVRIATKIAVYKVNSVAKRK